MTRVRSAWVTAALCLTFSACGPAQETGRPPSGLPEAEATTVGVSPAALERIAPAMEELIDAGTTGGIMTMVARRGRIVHWSAYGSRIVGEDPLERDDIFRIYSMTKPVTAVAVMMLVEEGSLSLDQPVSDVLPAFADPMVMEAEGPRPAAEPITIRHLLTHTSGLTYGDFGNTPVDSMYRAERLGVWGTHGNLAETVAAIASLPLRFDPGTRWNYSMAYDVLGRVVEVVSGQTFADFLHERILDPLQMDDTDFWVRPEKRERFVASYGPGDGGIQVIDSPVEGLFTQPPLWLSGGAGLTSTADDYIRFCQMLLNGGELDGVRLLQPETVAEMTRNHLPDELVPIGIGGPDQGFGLGFAVSMGEHAGAYRWLGVAGTHFFIDPSEELIAFAWTNFRPQGRVPIQNLMTELAYATIE